MAFRTGARALLAMALVTSTFVAIAPGAEAVTYVNVYLLFRWDGAGCVGSGTGTSISFVARDVWQASGTKTGSWPGTTSSTKCPGELIQAGPVSLIKWDGYHRYRLEASITDASGSVTFFSANQEIKIGQSCPGSTFWMGTNDAHCSSTQPASNHLGVKNNAPASASINTIYPDFPDPATQIYLSWTGVSPQPSDFDWWEVHMSRTPGFTPSYGFASTLLTKKSWGFHNHKVTGLTPGEQYCFIVRNADKYWEPDSFTYRNHPSYGDSGERCVRTQGGALRVTSPNGGEVWSGTHPITWTGGNPNFAVEISRDSGATYGGEASGVGSRSHSWDTRGWPDGATYRVRVKDGAGNDVSDADFTVDNTPPVTTIEVAGEQCNGWYTAPPTITLAATDNLAGVRTTRWAVDGGAARVYGGPFLLQGDGLRDLAYWSDDRADPPNVEARKREEVPIDTLPPETTAQVGAPQHRGDRLYVNSSTPLSLVATDAGSGVNYTEYRINGGAWTPYGEPFRLEGPDGPYTVGFRSADFACHLEDEKPLDVFLDNTRPLVAIAQPAPGSVTIEGSEVFGGLGPVLALLDEVLAVIPAPALPVGAQQLCDVARILAGGLAEQGAGAAGDLLVAQLCQAVDPGAPAIVVGEVEVRAEAEDPVVNGGASGMHRVEFYVDGALRATDAEAPYTWTWDTSGDDPGLHELRAVAYDNLGQDAAATRQVLVASAAVDVDLCALLAGLPVPGFVVELLRYVLDLAGVPCLLALPALPALPGAPAVPGELPPL